jgi:hypothetical protein
MVVKAKLVTEEISDGQEPRVKKVAEEKTLLDRWV